MRPALDLQRVFNGADALNDRVAESAFLILRQLAIEVFIARTKIYGMNLHFYKLSYIFLKDLQLYCRRIRKKVH